MPQITVHSRVYLGAGHHRHPRNQQSFVEPYDQDDVTAIPFTDFKRTAALALPYQPPQGPVQNPVFAFWAIGDGSSYGRVQADPKLVETVQEAALTAVAWYVLPGGGPGGGGGTAELIDAYSVNAQGFVDDDFVTVSDASLTASANADGSVPTAHAEAITATKAIGSGETFDIWILGKGDPSTAAGPVLNAPAKASGFAFATYDTRPGKDAAHPPVHVPNFAVSVTIIAGLIAGGSGVILVNGRPIHVDPGWGNALFNFARILATGDHAVVMGRGAVPPLAAATTRQLGALGLHIQQMARAGG